MAHLAKIDENSHVVEVIVISDNIQNAGQAYINDELGLPGLWLQCSYNGTMRKKFPAVGFTYSEKFDVFIQPKPTEDAIFNEELKDWIFEKDESKS